MIGRVALAFSIGLAGLALNSQQTQALKAVPCGPIVRATLVMLSINNRDISSVTSQPRYWDNNRKNERIKGYDTWVRLKDRPGDLIIRLSRRCNVEEIFTKGELRLEDIPNY